MSHQLYQKRKNTIINNSISNKSGAVQIQERNSIKDYKVINNNKINKNKINGINNNINKKPYFHTININNKNSNNNNIPNFDITNAS